ncbi:MULTISPECIES: type IV secretion system protein [unclassified Neorhizobium]|uniref:type IV secretion system protein n=1 Tax=unclassified Neorhizobium TaxID=2629175 RepID=UPI001FF5020E|nr:MULTISPECIES: type IV secretion system protein [unclassified Neorhizobium]MCJ9670396.1 type IV secretion system protein [Neorhizobium sp. SHOUNA12B]MCJ9746291.1 type IV secretion system protein [Neorhizobium sp. SHOUNA12A]
MALIADVSNYIDEIVAGYASAISNTVATPLLGVLQATAIAALMLMAINHVAQLKAVSYSQYFHWFIRYLIIYAFIQYWANIELFYDAIHSVQKDYSLALIKASLNQHLPFDVKPGSPFDLSNVTDSSQAADRYFECVSDVARMMFDTAVSFTIFQIAEILKYCLLGTFVLILGFAFSAISLVIIVFSKIGIAVALSLAPLAFVLLMMEQTRSYFESWVKFLVGFFIIQILISSLMGLMLFAAIRMLADFIDKLHAWYKGIFGPAGEWWRVFESPPFADYSIPFVMLALGSLIFVSQIPTMASTLAAASVATAGASLASSQRLMNGANRMGRTAQRGRDALGAANVARKAGGGIGGMTTAAIGSMRQSAGARQGRRDDRMTGRMQGENERIAAVREKQYARPEASRPSGAGANKPSGAGAGGPGAQSPTTRNPGGNNGSGNTP